jgi:S-DNA-T family DNA segregation ATPase FtsK/SpoIIIE
LVIVADRAAELADRPDWSSLLASVAAEGTALGVAVLCADTSGARLPAACRVVAQTAGDTGTRWRLRSDESEQLVIGDAVSPEWCEQLARSLAPLVDGSGRDGALPASCGLLAALDLAVPGADALLDRWRRSGDGAVAVLGAGTAAPLTVDLAEDGPHALVAGTTGAGKSELLQALVAGLAANHPPDQLTFLLVDYKGGAAFADCARLPHTAALVTDLDPYLTERALRSLDAELRRRERLYADAGAVDLPGYRAAGPTVPLPRLVIVVDEFAALAEELPEFVRGLVGVAQRGRSLGVHLVLATQRPGRAVSPEIRANTALRVCLRVTDPAESADVIGAPDAALLDRTTPGRAYLRCGGALTAFQAAHPSGRSPADPARIAITPLGPWRRPIDGAADVAGPSDLSRLVSAVTAAARRRGTAAAAPIWRPPLPEHLPADELGRPERRGLVRYARVDRPDELATESLELDLAGGGSLLVAGAARSGRTQTLATVALGAARHMSPGELALHVVDPGGTLARILDPLPHVTTSLGPAQPELGARLLTLLARDRGARPGSDLVLIDGWDRLLAALPDLEAATCGELLAQLLRAGPEIGVSVAVSGDRSVLMPRISAGFGQRILLRQADRGDFGLVGIPLRAVPATLPPGRGLRAEDGAVLQVALPADPPAAVAGTWRGTRPAPDRLTVRPLPDHVRLADLSPAGGRLLLGVGGDRGEPLSIDPFAGAGRIVVAGPPRSGRSTALVALLRQLHDAGVPVVVAAPSRSPLAVAAAELRIPVTTPRGPDPGPPPAARAVLLVDDCEAFADGPAGERFTAWLRTSDAPLAAVVAGRADELATSYRGVAAEARRSQCGVLLRPGPVDGELLGVRLPRRPAGGPPGRGVVVGDPAWGHPFSGGEPVAVQVVTP